jgi:hypothetical protein
LYKIFAYALSLLNSFSFDYNPQQQGNVITRLKRSPQIKPGRMNFYIKQWKSKMTQKNRKIFIIDDQQTISELSPEFYHSFITNPKSVTLQKTKGNCIRLAEIHLEKDRNGPTSIINAEFRYLYITDDGFLDESMFENFMQSGLDAIKLNTINDPTSDYRTQFFWHPTHDEFKTLMILAINPQISLPCQVIESHTLPIDRTNPEINGIHKMLDAFPGLKVVGTNRTLYYWTVTFDIVSLNGLVSFLFLQEGLKHEDAKKASLTLASPDDDMRYVLCCTAHPQTKKVSMWLIFVYQKRMAYKDVNKQSACQCHKDDTSHA